MIAGIFLDLPSPLLCLVPAPTPAHKAEKRSQQVEHEPSLSSQFWVKGAPFSATVLQLYYLWAGDLEVLSPCCSNRTLSQQGLLCCFLLAQHNGASSGASGATCILGKSNETSFMMKCCFIEGRQDLFPGARKPSHSCFTALNTNHYMHYKQNLSNV